MSNNFSKVGAVTDTIVSVTPKGNAFEYSGVTYQPLTLKLTNTGDVVFNKSEKFNVNLAAGQAITFDVSDQKTKDGDVKITKVALASSASSGSGNSGGNTYNNGYNSEERLALEREKQIYISRSVALEKAIMYFEAIKLKPQDADAVISIADEFEQYLIHGKGNSVTTGVVQE